MGTEVNGQYREVAIAEVKTRANLSTATKIFGHCREVAVMEEVAVDRATGVILEISRFQLCSAQKIFLYFTRFLFLTTTLVLSSQNA